MSAEKLFISYSRQDSKKVVEIVDYLKSKNIEVWFDQKDIKFGNDIVVRIDAALGECQYFVIFASKNYFANEWTKAEYQAANYLALSLKTLSILVVKLDDVALPPLIASSAYLSLEQTENIGQEIKNAIQSTSELYNWETLSEQMFLIVVPEIFKNLGTLKRQAQDKVTLEVGNYNSSRIVVQFSKDLLRNEILMADLETEWQIYETHNFL